MPKLWRRWNELRRFVEDNHNHMMTEIKNNKNTAFTDAIAELTTPAPDSRIRDMVTNLLRVTTEKATTCTAVIATQCNKQTEIQYQTILRLLQSHSVEGA